MSMQEINEGDHFLTWRGLELEFDPSLAGGGLRVRDGDKTVASLTYSDKGDYVWLDTGYVDPDYRGKGIFRQLFDAVAQMHDKPMASNSRPDGPVAKMIEQYNQKFADVQHPLFGPNGDPIPAEVWELIGDATLWSGWSDANIPKPVRFCFGYINGELYIGRRHHMAIMQYLTENEGMEWEDLMNARQTWGWAGLDQVYANPKDLFVGAEYPNGDYSERVTYPYLGLVYYVSFQTDAALLDTTVEAEAQAAIDKFLGIKTIKWNWKVPEEAQSNSEYAPSYQNKYGPGSWYQQNPDTDVRKVSAGGTYSEIKFVSLADRMLVGENTYHAHLLTIEYGKPFFPHNTIAIGRALVEDDVVVEVSFDFSIGEQGRHHAYLQLEEYSEKQGYIFDPDEREWFQGLASVRGASSIAFAMIGGRIYYGEYHAEIIHSYFPNVDVNDLTGVFGYLTKKGDKYDVSVYSDFMAPNQSNDEARTEKALRLLQRDFKIGEVSYEIPEWAEDIEADPWLDDPYYSRQSQFAVI